MMKLIDTHTHLYVEEFKKDIDTVVANALKEGVQSFYLPAIDSTETEALLNLEKKYPDRIFAMAGLHPCSVKENYKDELQKIEEQLAVRKFAGIGETGLDFYWDTTFTSHQYDSLHTQIEWAIKYKRPLILHTRNAMQETIDVVAQYKCKNLYGIFHCFGGTEKNAQDIIGLGFSMGVGGIITFKNAGVAEVIKNVDLNHIVLETDAPYLSPVPFRGKRNESSYLKYIVEKLAGIKQIPVEEAAEITSKNAEFIFSEKISEK